MAGTYWAGQNLARKSDRPGREIDWPDGFQGDGFAPRRRWFGKFT
jgi:hypothetical protein